MTFTLPNKGTTVTVSVIPAGHITLPDAHFVAPSSPTATRTVPSLSFLITHPSLHPSFDPGPPQQKAYTLLFDLGLRCNPTRYPPALQAHLETRRPYTLAPSVATQLRAAGTDPRTIDAVVLSHVHYDHHGDPEEFPASVFVLGLGALGVLKHGLGVGASHQHFEPGLLDGLRVVELDAPENGAGWKGVGPFEAGLDLFGDGSVWVIDLPGHLPGHVGLLCRVGEGRWVCLCGDAFHDRRLLTGEKGIGTWTNGEGECLCIHLDKEVAEDTIRRLRMLQRMDGVSIELVAAHDECWLETHQSSIFPGTI